MKNVVDSDLHYALSEILYKYDPNSTIPINQRIEYLYKNIKKDCKTSLYFENKEEMKNNEPACEVYHAQEPNSPPHRKHSMPELY